MIITPENSVSIGGVQCWDQSTEEVFDRFESCATRKLACRWPERAKLIKFLNPSVFETDNFGVFGMKAYDEFSSLFPQRFRTKGEGKISVGPSGLVAYEYALITCEYKTFATGGLEVDFGANVLTLPRTGPCLETNDEDETIDVPFQDTPGKPIAVLDIVQTRTNVTVLPMADIRTILKKPLNENEFFGYEPGTVMFVGGRARKLTVTTGAPSNAADNLYGPFDLEYRFQARPELPWDKLPFRQKDGTFVFRKVRFKNNQGPFLGRSSYSPLFY